MVALLMLPISSSHGQETDAIQDPTLSSCNCVAFRLDDIQDYYLNQAQEEIVRTFEKRNESLTIGVIGNFIGDDSLLVAFLKQRIHADPGFTMEVANHGWNHEDFTTFDRVQQSDLLSKSNERILQELGVLPEVFITPFNRMNNDTLVAMAENGIRVVSANLTNDRMPFVRNVTLTGNDAVSVYHFPATAKTGDLNDDDTEWLGFGHQDTLRSIRTSMQEYGYALVTMHPQEYSVRDGLDYQNKVDEDQVRELELLLDAVHDEGYTVVTVSELARHVTVPEFSEYIAIAIPFVSSVTLLLLSRYGILFTRKSMI